MKTRHRFRKSQSRGFALIVTLSLMILLTVVAVGLLSLSSITLRASAQGNGMATARSNARLALMLAIGELQRTAGPDKRITAPANLVNETAPEGVTGVWKSWRPPFSSPNYDDAKTGDNFLGYLMSNPDPATQPDPKTLPGTTSKAQKLVGANSADPTDPRSQISAPLVSIQSAAKGPVTGAYSYVTLDEGTKSRIDLLPSDEAKSIGEAVTSVGSSARDGYESVPDMDFLSANKVALRESLPKLVTLNQANLESTSKVATRKYFHDYTVASNSLQSDVANGGLKTDLSVLFNGTFGSQVPNDRNGVAYSDRYLYSDTSTPFQGSSTTSDVQWSVLANYARLYQRTTANDNPKVGLKAVPPSGFALKTISDATLKKSRYEPNMATLKQPLLLPTVVRVDTVFSLIVRDAHQGRGTAAYPYMLHLMYLPVITLHNPYNVPLRFTGLQVEFSDVPIGFDFQVNGQSITTSGQMMPLNKFYLKAGGQKKTFNMLLSNSLTSATEVVMGAGETRIFGTPFSASSTWAGEVAANGKVGMMFDWQSNQTAGAFTVPGLIAPPNVGVGFDVDWLAPENRAEWLKQRRDEGVVMIAPTDTIKVRYAPLAPDTATDKNFAVTVRLGAGTAPPQIAQTQVFYLNDSRLKTILEEGQSDRFPEKRSFPETCPRATESIMTAKSIYESNATEVRKYAFSRPFAIFSVSAKTTMESFTRNRPVTDTGVAFQMATCDFTGKPTEGSSPLEFALVPIKRSGLALESGGLTDSKGTSLQGFFFGGHGSQRGSSNATFYEIPMAPLQSIAQLRHANIGSIGSIPYVTYTVGEARAHPAVPANAAFMKADASRTVLDRSWLANDQLWDKYWFSTLSTLQGVAYTGSSAKTQKELADDFFAGTGQLPNPRNTAYVSAGSKPADVTTAALTPDGARSAAHILTKGGFNVNSTSVAAWTAVLSGLASADVPLADGNTAKDPAGSPFLRERLPVHTSKMTAKEKLWNSYRTLNKGEIETLASEIVKEVKARGPFLSMAEFVNRRLGPAGDEKVAAGAIQTAIERAKFNSGMLGNALPVSPGDVKDYGWLNSDAVQGNTGAGAPGEVSQGDVLSTIGSYITVRSDTFRIRAYGDARTSSGLVTARAWCEATIQRVPEYVDSADKPEEDATTLPNLNFGRQFKIVAFRWLHPDEI